MTATYILVAYRTHDHYYARFLGIVQHEQVLDEDEQPIAELTHGQTTTLRLRSPLPCGSDAIVVYRYDVPDTAQTLHVQYTRWKWSVPAPLEIRASHDGPLSRPAAAGLQDCVYDTSVSVPPPVPT